MTKFNKTLASAAAAAALMAAIGAALAQTPTIDPNDTPMTTGDAEHGSHILRFRDQGNSPESDPSAHLILIKDAPMSTPPVAAVQQSTYVADATPAPVDNTPAPATTDSSSMTSTDTTAAPADTTPALAPRADRN